MWTRDDIKKAAIEKVISKGRISGDILQDIMLDVAACMALDNAASVAEGYGDPEIEHAINKLKDMFTTGTFVVEENP